MPDSSSRPRTVRPANLRDRDGLLAWRNDPDSYRWYHDDGPVAEADHDRWLAERLTLQTPLLWVIEEDGEPAGDARLDLVADGTGVVSIVVASSHRGRGLGRTLLAFVDAQAQERGMPQLRAIVHRGNAASRALFLAAGYVQTNETDGEFDNYVRTVS